MKRSTIVAAAIAVGLVGLALLALLVLVVGRRVLERGLENEIQRVVEPAVEDADAGSPADAPPPPESGQGFLYGRVTADDGATSEGRLRFGGDEEAFWGDYFNGSKNENPWASHVSPEKLTESRPLEVFGVEIARRERRVDLRRPFLARFGDLARIEPRPNRVLRVVLKSGTVVDLDRFDADDFADGVRVWDDRRGMVDLVERRIRSIELLPTPPLGGVPSRLQGTVRTRGGDFTGFVQWNRQKGVGTDQLVGRSANEMVGVPFDGIRSIARHSADSSLVTLLDGRELVLSGTREVGRNHLGIYVEDPRYGRVLVSWDAFERVDFSPAGSGPAYDDFPPGRPLSGAVTTRDGRRLGGRLVFDLDESETTETLDAPAEGVNYTVLFGLIESIVLPGGAERDAPRAVVTLHGGEALRLELAGDLGAGNAGILVFVDGREPAEYVPWGEVARIDLDRPPAMHPALGVR
ncbi:MAG TPA: hypothetical protein VMV46_14265 [Thermoanaerobaculia bacterium]|nr:hypothetical protein [Thermoanaerobaculia bacterium]